jgi:hypothetical protein
MSAANRSRREGTSRCACPRAGPCFSRRFGSSRSGRASSCWRRCRGLIKPHASINESEEINLDNLTDEELVQWDVLVRKALGKRAAQLLADVDDRGRKPGPALPPCRTADPRRAGSDFAMPSTESAGDAASCQRTVPRHWRPHSHKTLRIALLHEASVAFPPCCVFNAIGAEFARCQLE